MTDLVVVPLRPVAAAVKARLEGIGNVIVYDSEATGVPTIASGDQRAKPYVVFNPGVGDPMPEPDLGDQAVDLAWSFSVTCAAGLLEDLLALVDRVNASLFRWTPLVEGLVCGQLHTPPGYSAPQLLDRSVMPHRPYVVLQFTSLITSA